MLSKNCFSFLSIVPIDIEDPMDLQGELQLLLYIENKKYSSAKKTKKDIIKNKERYNRCIQNPEKHVRWSLLRK